MANILDYLAWRGDVPIGVSPLGDVDMLVLSTLSYLGFEGTDNDTGWTLRDLKRMGLLYESRDNSFENRKKLFEMMADSERFGSCRLHHAIALTDAEMETQFCAMCLDVRPDTVCVIFRGTDNTFIGWREDFNMAFRSPVPAQEAARFYLEKVLEMTDKHILITGHSKGGNLAAYAAAHTDPEWLPRIGGIWSFDGPGMDEETFGSEGYRNCLPLLHHFVPQTGIIGMLMCHHESYTVVHAVANGIAQHDPFAWQVYGKAFETEEKIDASAELINETLQEWLKGSTPEQRGTFVETLFRLAENTRAATVSEFLSDKLKNAAIMMGATREIDPETRKVFIHLFSQFFTLGVGNVVERVRERNENPAPSSDINDQQEVSDHGVSDGH